jgi:hypothetical protein
MKVFDLMCEHGHEFEGWFASAQDYESQLKGGLLVCPMCESSSIQKKLSAPRLNLGASTPASTDVTMSNNAAAHEVAGLQKKWLTAAREFLKNTEDVGERFVQEARKIHYQEAPERPIRGVASPQQAQELADEGIEVFSIPMPAAAKEPLQ